MSLPLIVGVQQRHDSGVEWIAQDSARAVAEGRALLEYIERQAFMVLVIEIDKHTIFSTEKVVEVFKIERNCKCLHIQRFFNYPKGTSFLRCIACSLQFGVEQAINQEEQLVLEQALDLEEA